MLIPLNTMSYVRAILRASCYVLVAHAIRYYSTQPIRKAVPRAVLKLKRYELRRSCGVQTIQGTRMLHTCSLDAFVPAQT